MGTNYYINFDYCPSCGRGMRLHIGKKSAGWRFSFAAHKKPNIQCTHDWRELLKYMPIIDEYDNEISYEAFFEIIEESRREPFNHYDECKGKYGVEYDKQIYKDIEGFTFNEREFS